MTRRLAALLAGVLAVAALVAVGLGTLVTRPRDPGPPEVANEAVEQFLDGYVDDDGRVVRRDQGGDTVSEGQAYAMLVATAVGDEEVFAAVWDWTERHLRREDGLLSWQWSDGAVVDPESAADADLDAARALVLAGDRFDNEDWAADGLALADAVLDHETVLTGSGRILTAGTWSVDAPYTVNPSYASPAATDVLGRATGDPRWDELRSGDLTVNEALTAGGQLPPDWAQVQRDGSAQVTGSPQGQPPRYGYDAARTPLRHAESCDPRHRALAADMADELTGEDPARAVYDLAGSPQTQDRHPVAELSRAAALAAAGQVGAARVALEAAAQVQRDTPTYYGSAWLALGSLLLTDDALGGCPPLAAGS